MFQSYRERRSGYECCNLELGTAAVGSSGANSEGFPQPHTEGMGCPGAFLLLAPGTYEKSTGRTGTLYLIVFIILIMCLPIFQFFLCLDMWFIFRLVKCMYLYKLHIEKLSMDACKTNVSYL